MINNECNGCEYKCSLSHIDICTLGSPCPHQRSTPLTEQEYLQTCDTEQLADVIADFYLLGFTHGHNQMDITSRTKWVEWLKQPHSFE